MFDIGWPELLVIACIAIIVVGPKDLPRMLRSLGQTLGKVRRMSREFQSTFNEALREAEQQADIADMKEQVEKAGNLNPLGDLTKSIEDDINGKKNGAVQGKKPERPKPVEKAETPAAEPEAAPDKPSGPAAAPASETPVQEENKA
ncbi:sec-independent protein translocase protein TatB [Roseibium hamelinense]|uniref:Sec-independent protein translocase protein TatB n=1 Tax=Roseibium hamelinense TaxID=150831 RepID=A0A562TIN0_9HYPH|nr:Sec-independent protein translocase protein TatB [Roseibium hamelinense]MTI45673.1 twin-arginine translocase subunit TatB [Roseibium hamelinense]TWI93144.1 sec-independent protein translocase protein TatB [Roseibium hamelinense]